MDTGHCSVHSNDEAIAYCNTDRVVYCIKCLTKHNGHDVIGIHDFRAAKIVSAVNKAELIQETSILLAKHKIIDASLFNAIEEHLNTQKLALISSLPKMATQVNGNDKSKKLGDQCLDEIKKVLGIVHKFTEANVNAIMQLVW